MGKFEEREDRRRASVVGSIIGTEPMKPARGRGRPKTGREVKKRISLSVMPSLYEDIQKIAYIQRRSTSELVALMMEEFRYQNIDSLEEYDTMFAWANEESDFWE